MKIFIQGVAADVASNQQKVSKFLLNAIRLCQNVVTDVEPALLRFI